MALRYVKKFVQNLLAENLPTCVEDTEVTKFSNVIESNLCLLNTLESLDHLTNSNYSNTREDKISKQAGVGIFRDVTKNDCSCFAAHSSMTEKGRSHISTIGLMIGHVLLAVATLFAGVTFYAAFVVLGLITNVNHINDNDTGRIVQGKRESIITSSFILLNSTGFVVSLAIVISFLRSFPLKPLPQISVLMFYGSYMCLIMKMSPWESWLVLFLSVPLLLLAAIGKLSNFKE